MNTLITNLILKYSLLAVVLVGLLGAVPASAQLPPAIQADRYLVQAERELGSGNPGAAVATLNRILALQADHGLDIPEAFWFKRAQAAHAAGLHDLAVESSIRYLEIAGQGGEHYVAALALYDAAELAKVEAAEQAAAVAAAIPSMVRISPGRFRMGCITGQDCGNDEDVREIRISQTFMLSKYEVTFAQWDACVENGGCNGYRPDDEGWGRGNHPVVNVSLGDIQSYLSWLRDVTGQDYRLPTEAEWEYAARAGSTTKYSWGNAIGFNRANCDGCGSQWDNSSTAPVGSFSPNAWGLHDMHGNVWERISGGVLRGGSWSSSPRGLRSASRIGGTSGDRYSSLGFRVARTLTP